MTGEPNPANTTESHDEEDGYHGVATVVLSAGDAAGDAVEFTVDVDLRGHFQPIDGRYRWYGRISQHAGLAERIGGKRTAVALRTEHGEAVGEVSDPDPWGRYRIMGVSTPPFPVPTTLAEVGGELP